MLCGHVVWGEILHSNLSSFLKIVVKTDMRRHQIKCEIIDVYNSVIFVSPCALEFGVQQTVWDDLHLYNTAHAAEN